MPLFGRTTIFIVIVAVLLFIASRDDEFVEEEVGKSVYDVTQVAAPKLTGTVLTIFHWIVETWPFSKIMMSKYKRNGLKFLFFVFLFFKLNEAFL
jgi:hypothetical protein